MGIAAVRDRLVQRAFVYAAEPFFESSFSDRSFAYRPGRGAHQAVMAVLSAMRGMGTRGAPTLGVHVDVQSCFDTLPHEIILGRFAQRLASPPMLGLLTRWLRYGLLDGAPDMLGVGVVQGWALSPFLSNVVLDDLDGQLEARGVEFARYADDFALLARDEAEARSLPALIDGLARARLHLLLNPEKTAVRRLDEGLDFLGFRLGGLQRLAISPERLPRAREALVERAGALARSEGNPGRLVAELSRLARHFDGLAGYFCRLGLTAALLDQMAELLGAIEAVRSTLRPEVREHPGWASLPPARRLVERFGRLDVGGGRAEVRGEEPYPGGSSRSADHLFSRVGEEATSDARGAQARASCLAHGDRAQTDSPASPTPKEARPSAPPSSDAPVAERDGSTLCILRGATWIVAGESEVCVRRRGHDELRAPLAELDMILAVSGGVQLSSRSAWTLAASGITVLLAGPAGGEIAAIAAPGGGCPRVRLAQARSVGSQKGEAAAVALLRAKLASQASVLRYLCRGAARRESEAGAGALEAAGAIRRVAEGLANAAAQPAATAGERAARLMGHEGRAAAFYWTAVKALLPPELEFPGRRTRGARDPLNQALNYAYGFLYGEVWRAVARAGLDPGFGLLHAAGRGGAALVYDLLEELRAPLADRLVLSLIGRSWRPALRRGTEPALTPRHRHVLARAFRRQRERYLRRGRGRIRAGEIAWAQARALRALFLDEAATYPAFHFRWVRLFWSAGSTACVRRASVAADVASSVGQAVDWRP